MIKHERKLMYVLLSFIIICSSILIYKIDKTPKYDQNTYERVYTGYEEIINYEKLDNTTSIAPSKSNDVIHNSASNSFPKNEIIYSSSTVAVIDIPKMNISYPVINEYTDSNLDIAPTKLAGPEPNNEGNFVIIAHNNRNEDFFSNLNVLQKNDIVKLMGKNGVNSFYAVYDKYEIDETDFSCLTQETEGKTELTLITCVKYNKSKRLVVKCLKI